MNYANIKNVEGLLKFAEEVVDAEQTENTQKIINITPHALTVCDAEGNVIDTIPPSGVVARVDSKSVPAGTLNSYNVVKTEYGDVSGLEEETPNVAYLVSAMVGQVLQGKRNDIYSPDTGSSAVRTPEGQIKGVRQFIKW